MKKMNKKSKIVIGVTSAAVIAAAIVTTSLSGSLAFFQDRSKEDTSAIAGDVELAAENISMNGTQLVVTGTSLDFDRGVYTSGNYSTTEIKGGWLSDGEMLGSTVKPQNAIIKMMGHTKCKGGTVRNMTGGRFFCESCNTEVPAGEVMKAAAYPDFFRTKQGYVGYCIDRGKTAPSDGVLNMSAELDAKIKRALHEGYPAKKGADYGLEDWQLEQATAMALYIIEGKSYDSDGNPTGRALNREYLDTYMFLEDQEIGTRILDTMDHIVTYATTEGNDAIGTFVLNSKSTEVKPAESANFVGPYVVETDASEVFLEYLLTDDTDGVSFYDSVNGNQITSVSGGQEFYVRIPTSVTGDVTISVYADESVIPNYYFWSGDTSEQRMVVASTTPARVVAKICKIQQLMPGDVVDVNWTVENIQNKAVVTRNRVFLWWDEKSGSNAIENTFLLKGSAGKGEIQSDMDNSVIDNTDLLFPQAGEIHEFTLDDGTTHRGYAFTIMGDHLDGVGNGAEQIIPGTSDHYGDVGEVSYDNGAYDDADPVKDVVGFKLGFGQKANSKTSGLTLHMVVITEAIQYQNTTDADYDNVDWTVIRRTSYEY